MAPRGRPPKQLVKLTSLTTPQLRSLAQRTSPPRSRSPRTSPPRRALLQALADAGVGSAVPSAALAPSRSPRRRAAAPAAASPRVWGAHQPHAHASFKNVANALLLLVALAPSLAAVRLLFAHAHCAPCAAAPPPPRGLAALLRLPAAAAAAAECDEWPLAPAAPSAAWLLAHPVGTVQLLFLLNVSLGFWLVGLAQRSFWLIDPYWTILPPLIGLYYRAHPCALHPAPLRGTVALGLVWLWSARLTHSYFRREGWKFGEREDWRYTQMAADWPRSWWLLSFFAVGLAQQPLLVGLSAPLHFTHSAGAAWGEYDLLASGGALLGLLGAWASDGQLHAFVSANRRRREADEPLEPILRHGLWRYSRHPNYFFEQLFWWSLAMLGVIAGHPEAILGALLNSAVLLVVTIMTEAKMLREWPPPRAKLYRVYQRTTSMWLPLPRWP
ncbi:hypothetical protein AB1Y20_012414 [Prymnesium parvum]|uniref:Steroid 5-alpha reductase C-terminal domain-containing protein n=1 Tax=Prymnesium parvum TaxID=97485 RepID=A0AB34IKT0_PRYPA